MNNEVQIFENKQFGVLRTLDINGQTWFSGKDVASALGYANPQKAIRDHVDEEDKTVNDLFTVNGTRALLLNESGLYALILSSKLDKAKQFKRWVTSEVLPSLRTSGEYSLMNDDSVMPQRTLTPDDYISAARLVAACKSDRLPIVLSLLAKGGWEVRVTQLTGTPGISTADIAVKINDAIADGVTMQEISQSTGISEGTLRSYRAGHRYPRPARYEQIVATLEAQRKVMGE